MSDLPDARITSRDSFRRRANPRSSRQMRIFTPKAPMNKYTDRSVARWTILGTNHAKHRFDNRAPIRLLGGQTGILSRVTGIDLADLLARGRPLLHAMSTRERVASRDPIHPVIHDMPV